MYKSYKVNPMLYKTLVANSIHSDACVTYILIKVEKEFSQCNIKNVTKFQ